jgi:hypothetical protein
MLCSIEIVGEQLPQFLIKVIKSVVLIRLYATFSSGNTNVDQSLPIIFTSVVITEFRQTEKTPRIDDQNMIQNSHFSSLHNKNIGL